MLYTIQANNDSLDEDPSDPTGLTEAEYLRVHEALNALAFYDIEITVHRD